MTDTPPLATTRLALLAAFIVLLGITITALASQQAPLIGAIVGGEGLVLAAWLLAAFGFGDLLWRVQRVESSFGDRAQTMQPAASHDAWLDVVTRIALGLGVMSLLTLALGVAGWLHQPVAVALLLVGAVLAVARIYNDRNGAKAWLTGIAGAAWLTLLITPVSAVMLIGGCVLPGILWGLDDPSGYDVVAYHLQLPREWYELGRVTTLHHNVFSFFPLNVEMHYLLAMHLRGGAYAGMYLAQLMHGAYITLTIAAVYGAARSRGRLAASVAAIVSAGVPWMAMLGGVAYDEGGLMLYATLAAAWAIRGRWALAGACAGLAAGSKYTGVTSAIVLVPIVIAIVRASGSLPRLRGRVRVGAVAASDDARRASGPHPGPLPEGEGVVIRRSSAARNLLAFGLLAAIVFSPWLIRTAVAARGNPIFPLAIHTLGSAHFDAGQVDRFNIAHSPRPDQQSIAGRLTALWQQVGGDYHFGAIDLGIALPLWLALIVPAIWLARRDREAWIWFGLIIGNVVIWLVATHLQGRFLVQVIPCVAMLVACGVARLKDERREATHSTPFAVIAVVVTLVSFAFAMRHPLQTLLASPGPLNTVGVGGGAELRDLLPEDVARVAYDTTRPIVLVGDAKAFWYAIPSARLRYRSVFDVPSGKTFRDAWLGDDLPAGAAVIVDGGELGRFAKTYRNLPPLPPSLQARPTVMNPSDLSR